MDEYVAYGAKRGDINDITEDTNGKMEGAETKITVPASKTKTLTGRGKMQAKESNKKWQQVKAAAATRQRPIKTP